MDNAQVTREEICRGLAALGVQRGDSIVVHGSLKSFGHVGGGADTVVAAVIETVGAEGLVVMPVYASSVDSTGDLQRAPDQSATILTGGIPAAFSRHPDVRLAPNPMYTFGFLGRDAECLARRYSPLMFAYGKDQPLYCLQARRGGILQLGVDETTNTSIHVAEEIADPDYLARKKTQSRLTVDAYFDLPIDARRESLDHHRAGPRRDFRKATPLIEQAGIRRRVRIGQCIAMLTDFVGLCDLLVRRIKRQPNLLVVASDRLE